MQLRHRETVASVTELNSGTLGNFSFTSKLVIMFFADRPWEDTRTSPASHFGPSSFSDVLVSNANVLTCPLLSPLAPHATPLLTSLFPEERTHRLLSQLPLHEHPGPIRPIALGPCGRDHQAHSPAGFPLAATCPLSPPLSYWPNFFKEHFLLVLFYSFTFNSLPFGFNLFGNLENARLSAPSVPLLPRAHQSSNPGARSLASLTVTTSSAAPDTCLPLPSPAAQLHVSVLLVTDGSPLFLTRNADTFQGSVIHSLTLHLLSLCEPNCLLQ